MIVAVIFRLPRLTPANVGTAPSTLEKPVTTVPRVMASAQQSVVLLVPKIAVALLRPPSQLDLQPHHFHLDPPLLPLEEASANLPVSASQEDVLLPNTNRALVPVAIIVPLVVPRLLSLPQA